MDVVVPISEESGCKSITFQADLIQANLLETVSQKVSIQMPPSVKWKFHNSKNNKLYTSWLEIDSNSCPNETSWGIRFLLPEGAFLQSASGVDWSCDSSGLQVHCLPHHKTPQGSIWLDWIAPDTNISSIQADAYLVNQESTPFKSDTFSIGNLSR